MQSFDDTPRRGEGRAPELEPRRAAGGVHEADSAARQRRLPDALPLSEDERLSAAIYLIERQVILFRRLQWEPSREVDEKVMAALEKFRRPRAPAVDETTARTAVGNLFTRAWRGLRFWGKQQP